MPYTQSDAYIGGMIIGAVIRLVIVFFLAVSRNRSIAGWCIASIIVPGWILIPFLLLMGYNPREEVQSGEEFRKWFDRFEVSEDAECEKISIGEGYNRDYFDKKRFEAYGEWVLNQSDLGTLKGERRYIAKNGTMEIKRYVLPLYDRVIAKKKEERSIAKKLREVKASAPTDEKPIPVKAEIAPSNLNIEPAEKEFAPPVAKEVVPPATQDTLATTKEEVTPKRSNKPATIITASVLAAGMLSAGIVIGVVIGKDSLKGGKAEYRELSEKYAALEEDYEILNAKYESSEIISDRYGDSQEKCKELEKEIEKLEDEKGGYKILYDKYYDAFLGALAMFEEIDELCDNYSGESLRWRIKFLIDEIKS